MTLAYIRKYYDVPAYRGKHFWYGPWYCEELVREYVVTSAKGAHVRAKMVGDDNRSRRYLFHPTYNILWGQPTKNKIDTTHTT